MTDRTDSSVCKHWLLSKCRLGDKCKFGHPADLGGYDAGEGRKNPKWCRHIKLELCRFNGGCRYWHIEEWRALAPEERPAELPPPVDEEGASARGSYPAPHDAHGKGTGKAEPGAYGNGGKAGGKGGGKGRRGWKAFNAAAVPHGAAGDAAAAPVRSGSAVPHLIAGATPCRYYQQGSCSKGELCTFAHVKRARRGARPQRARQAAPAEGMLQTHAVPPPRQEPPLQGHPHPAAIAPLPHAHNVAPQYVPIHTAPPPHVPQESLPQHHPPHHPPQPHLPMPPPAAVPQTQYPALPAHRPTAYTQYAPPQHAYTYDHAAPTPQAPYGFAPLHAPAPRYPPHPTTYAPAVPHIDRRGAPAYP
eukprot:TRINITY_DN25833_c0_g1_i1.p1 TRINITY_DN25833_c0_g1~~TRINITY_DN25833_c0_g1_i1.p1  ORF type:complete len:387 (+),score=64.36 TRINITY_DN25833_c0_g1_i1:83-1162(+)